MTIAINSNPERDQIVASFNGQTVFNYAFPIFSDSYLDVYLTPVGQVADDATLGRLLVLGLDYTVTGAGAATGGTVVLNVGATLGDIITIEGVQPIERASVFQDLNPFTVALNDQLNQQTVMAQQSYTYWNNITPHYNHSELVSSGVRPLKRILPMLPNGHVWVGRGEIGDPIDDITTQLFAAGGGTTVSTNISKNIMQNAHGLIIGDYVRIDPAGDYVVAQADSAANAELAGLVTAVINANAFTLTMVGYIDAGVFAGLTVGAIYFLSPTAAGGHTLVEPAGLLEVSLPVFYAETATTGWLRHYRGIINGGSPDILPGTDSNASVVIVNQIAHGLVAENIVRLSAANTYVLAQANSEVNASAVGIVIDVIDVDNFILQTAGYQSGFIVGKADATIYYLSEAVAGLMTNIKPTNAGDFIKQIYISSSATDGYIQETQPEEILAVVGGTGWVQISSTNCTGLAAVAITGMTGYYRYKIILDKLLPSAPQNANEKLVLRTSSNNGVSYDSGGADYRIEDNGVTGPFANEIRLTSAQAGSNPVSITAISAVSGFLETIDPADITAYKHIFIDLAYVSIAGGAVHSRIPWGSRNSAALIDALQFRWGSGQNFASGTIKLLGTNV